MLVLYEHPSFIKPYTIVIVVPLTYHRYVELLDIVDDYVAIYPRHISFYVPSRVSCIDDLLGYIPFVFYEFLKGQDVDERDYLENRSLLDDNTTRL